MTTNLDHQETDSCVFIIYQDHHRRRCHLYLHTHIHVSLGACLRNSVTTMRARAQVYLNLYTWRATALAACQLPHTLTGQHNLLVGRASEVSVGRGVRAHTFTPIGQSKVAGSPTAHQLGNSPTACMAQQRL